jgi:hypothetical protein
MASYRRASPQPLSPHVLRATLVRFTRIPKETFENKTKNQTTTVWAISLATFKDEWKDDDLSDEEWLYRGEYIFVLTMDDSKERVDQIS